MDERREQTRHKAKIKLNYRIIYSLGFGSNIKHGEGVTESIDLSEGGLSFIVDTLIPKGSFLEIELKLSGQEIPIYLKGEVVRAEEKENKQYEIGFVFEYKFSEDSKTLHQYLSQQK